MKEVPSRGVWHITQVKHWGWYELPVAFSIRSVMVCLHTLHFSKVLWAQRKQVRHMNPTPWGYTTESKDGRRKGKQERKTTASSVLSSSFHPSDSQHSSPRRRASHPHCRTAAPAAASHIWNTWSIPRGRGGPGPSQLAGFVTGASGRSHRALSMEEKRDQERWKPITVLILLLFIESTHQKLQPLLEVDAPYPSLVSGSTSPALLPPSLSNRNSP